MYSLQLWEQDNDYEHHLLHAFRSYKIVQQNNMYRINEHREDETIDELGLHYECYILL